MRIRKLIYPLVVSISILAILHAPAFSIETNVQVAGVTENLYFVTGAVGNVAFLITDEGVLVVDSGELPAYGRIIIEKIKERTDRPIRYVVLTHYHGDHTHGLQAFPESAVIIGQSNIVRNLSEFDEDGLKNAIEVSYPDRIASLKEKIRKLEEENSPGIEKEKETLDSAVERFGEMKKIRVVYPDTTFDREMIIHLGSDTVKIFSPGNAHTNCNCIVYFKNQKAVHMGDMLFHERHPFIDWKAGSDTENWISSLKKIAEWELETVIPGHGELTTREGLHGMARYLSDLRKEVGSAIEKGMTLEQMQKTITMDKYVDTQWSYMLPRGIEAVYNELTGKENSRTKE